MTRTTNFHSFKDFYFKKKDEKIFNSIFEKWYNLGHWGDIDKERIKQQQYDWYKKLKQMIEEKDYDALSMFVENSENKVTKDIFTRLTNINIRKKKVNIIKTKLIEYCTNEIKKDYEFLEENKILLNEEEKELLNKNELSENDIWKSKNRNYQVVYIIQNENNFFEFETLEEAIKKYQLL